MYFGGTICLLTNRKIIIKIVTLIDSHICIDLWPLTLLFSLQVNHVLEMIIFFYPTLELFYFSFTQPFTHTKFCLPNPFLFGAIPRHKWWLVPQFPNCFQFPFMNCGIHNRTFITLQAVLQRLKNSLSAQRPQIKNLRDTYLQVVKISGGIAQSNWPPGFNIVHFQNTALHSRARHTGYNLAIRIIQFVLHRKRGTISLWTYDESFEL